MGPDAIAAMEARLLAVERRCVRLEDDTRQLARGMNLSRQRTWESWVDFRARPPVATASPLGSHGTTWTICSAFNLPDSLTLADSEYGNVTVDWNSSSNSWKGCHDNLSFGTTTFALHYELTISGGLLCSWAGDASFRPIASDCSTATVFNGIPYTNQSTTCPTGGFATKTWVANASLAIRTLYQSNVQTVTLGPVAPV